MSEFELHCANETCSATLVVPDHVPPSAMIRHEGWRVYPERGLLCPPCAEETDAP